MFTCQPFSQVPFGLGIAAGVRVGNALGAGKPLKAKRVTYTAIGIICTPVHAYYVCSMYIATPSVCFHQRKDAAHH